MFDSIAFANIVRQLTEAPSPSLKGLYGEDESEKPACFAVLGDFPVCQFVNKTLDFMLEQANDLEQLLGNPTAGAPQARRIYTQVTSLLSS